MSGLCAGVHQRLRPILALRKRLRAEGRDRPKVLRCYAMHDHGSVPLRRKDRDDKSRRGCQTCAPFPGTAPARDARSGTPQIRLPPLLIAGLGDDTDDSLDLALAADRRQAVAARREVLSVGVALLVAGLAESDRTGQYLGRSAV
jgi:hypothetical protein